MKRPGKKFKNNVIHPTQFKSVKEHMTAGTQKDAAIKIQEKFYREKIGKSAWGI